MKQLPLPIPPTLDRWPELAPLAILDVALSASESALLSACPEIHIEAFVHSPRGSTTRRAYAVIFQARRLAAAIAAYRQALDRDARSVERQLRRRVF